MDDNVLWWRKKILEEAARSLKKNFFEVFVEDKKEDIPKRILELIPETASVGIGGSASVRELKIIEMLLARKQKLIYHAPDMTREEALRKRHEALSADCYLASPQAVSVDGKLVFIDMNANRSAAVSFGPQKVILVAGFNKITFDEQSALFRAKNIAAPINAKRLNLKTPCAETGFCADCNSEQRICRVVEIMHKKPASTEVVVILCREEFGY